MPIRYIFFLNMIYLIFFSTNVAYIQNMLSRKICFVRFDYKLFLDWLKSFFLNRLIDSENKSIYCTYLCIVRPYSGRVEKASVVDTSSIWLPSIRWHRLWRRNWRLHTMSAPHTLSSTRMHYTPQTIKIAQSSVRTPGLDWYVAIKIHTSVSLVFDSLPDRHIEISSSQKQHSKTYVWSPIKSVFCISEYVIFCNTYK